MSIKPNRPLSALAALGLLATATACASTSPAIDGQPIAQSRAGGGDPVSMGQPAFRADPRCGTFAGTGCAPTSERIDLTPPTFTHPTDITNPLFPISKLESVVLLGNVDGKPFRSETTLLPSTGTVVVDGKPVEVRLSQYTAYLDGRITEVALDRYAQADDGSVWYLGEDVYDYENGTISVSEGTWLAGRDGPPAMIMPATPKVGQVFRTEDIVGVVFEEVTVKAVDQTVDGPLGTIKGAMVAEELHLDGTTSEKVFAPGYGEFFTQNDGEIEALSLAVPVNRTGTRESVELAKLITSAWGIVESTRLEDWEAIDAELKLVTSYWNTVKKQPQPVRVVEALDAAVAKLSDAVAQQKAAPTLASAVQVAQSALDLELRYRTVAYVDIGRFHLHAQALRIAAAADDADGVNAEMATLEWIRERITGTLGADELNRVDDLLANARTAVNTGNFAGAGDEAARLVNVIRSLSLP